MIIWIDIIRPHRNWMTLVPIARVMSRRGNPNSEYVDFSSNMDSYGQSYDYSTNETNDYGYETSQNDSAYSYTSYNNDQYNSYSASEHNSNYHTSPVNLKILAQNSFPVVKPPSIIQDSYQESYGVRPSISNRLKSNSWISAFGSGGFNDEPPLLEELGINFSHIKNKTLASLNPFRKLDTGSLNDTDLTGPLLFCFLFGTSLLFSGKVHFGYIYGVASLGWLSIFSILNLMTEHGVSFYLTASILGYCLLPMVLLSAVAILLKLRGIIGLVLGVASVSWCTFSSSTYFVAAFGMHNQQVLIAYPIFLLYSCFALMTIF